MKKVGSFSALLGGDPMKRPVIGAAAGGPRKFAPKASATPTPTSSANAAGSSAHGVAGGEARADDLQEGHSDDRGLAVASVPHAFAAVEAVAVASTPVSSEKSRAQQQQLGSSSQGDFNIMQLMSPSDAAWFPETYLGAGRAIPSASSSTNAASSQGSAGTLATSSPPASSSISAKATAVKPIIRSVTKVVAKPFGQAINTAAPTSNASAGALQRSVSNPVPILPRPAKVVTIGSSISAAEMAGSDTANRDLVDSILGVSSKQSNHHGAANSSGGGHPSSSSSSSSAPHLKTNKDQMPQQQAGKKRPGATDADDATRTKGPKVSASQQPSSIFSNSHSSSSSSSGGAAVAPYLLMGASSLGAASANHASHDARNHFALSSSAGVNSASLSHPPSNRVRRRKKSVSSTSAYASTGAFPFLFDGLEDAGGDSGAAALSTLPPSFPFTLAYSSLNGIGAPRGTAAYSTHMVYLRKKEGGIGLKLKNIGGRAVIRGFSEEYLNSINRTGQSQQLQVNDVIMSVNHLDAQTATFDTIVDAFRWVPPSSDWCGLRASTSQAETLRKRRQQKGAASEQGDSTAKSSGADTAGATDAAETTATAAASDTAVAGAENAPPVPDYLPMVSAEDELMAAYPIALSRVEDVLCVKVMRTQRQHIESRLI